MRLTVIGFSNIFSYRVTHLKFFRSVYCVAANLFLILILYAGTELEKTMKLLCFMKVSCKLDFIH